MDKIAFKRCARCGANIEAGGEDKSVYCSSECEIEALREQLDRVSERQARGRAKKTKLNCLALVTWSTCRQEWYPRDSYDAKRRAHELRGQGYTVSAKHIGQMPVRHGKSTRMVEVTLLTALKRHDTDEFPSADIGRGLGFVDARAGD